MKPGDKILINKPNSMFDGLIGTIVTNNPESNKQLKVDLDPNGIWQFFYHEVKPIGSDRRMIEAVGRQGLKNVIASLNKENEVLTEKESKSLQQGIKEANAGDIEPIETLFKKRKYTPRGTPKEIKVKRAYNKKQKP